MGIILNLHGFNGNNINNNYKELCKYHPSSLISSPQIDYNQDPDTIFQFLDNLFVEYNISYVVGQSLGGFWALYLSSYRGIPCMLTNPCVYPSKYIPDIDKDWKFGPNYIAYEHRLWTQIKCLPTKDAIVLGTKDDTINPKDVIGLPFTQCMIQRIDVGHNIEVTPEFCSAFKKGVEWIENRPL